jgi:hypothetical protein
MPKETGDNKNIIGDLRGKFDPHYKLASNVKGIEKGLGIEVAQIHKTLSKSFAMQRKTLVRVLGLEKRVDALEVSKIPKLRVSKRKLNASSSLLAPIEKSSAIGEEDTFDTPTKTATAQGIVESSPLPSNNDNKKKLKISKIKGSLLSGSLSSKEPKTDELLKDDTSGKDNNLEKRVDSNEKKISTIKRILQIRKDDQSLVEINSILQDIGNALALDFSNRITQKQDEISNLRSSAESKRRDGIESGLESVNKISAKVGNAFSAVTAPAKNILDKIVGFFGNLAAGFVADKAFKWLANNKEAVTGFFKFLADHGQKLLIGLGVLIGGVIVVKIVRAIIKVVRFVKGVVRAVHRAFRIGRVFVKRTLPRLLKQALAIIKRLGSLGKGLWKGLKGAGKGAINLGKSGIKGIKGAAKGAKALVKGGGKGLLKGLGKAGGKGLLKKIPIVGLGMGAAFAVGRLLQSPPDWMGAALELGSGAASMIPGAGTALSVALDAGSMVRDMKGNQAAGEVDAVEKDYKSVVNTATSMNFSRSVRSSSNLQLPSKGGVTVMDAIKLSDSARQQPGLDSSGGGDSMPMINSQDASNSYVVDVAKDLLGIIV